MISHAGGFCRLSTTGSAHDIPACMFNIRRIPHCEAIRLLSTFSVIVPKPLAGIKMKVDDGDSNPQAVHRICSTMFAKRQSLISDSKFSTPDCQVATLSNQCRSDCDGCQVVVFVILLIRDATFNGSCNVGYRRSAPSAPSLSKGQR